MALDASTREIRLLEIQPGAAAAQVVCKLSHASLDDQPVYDALSYRWGLPSPNREILVNGAVFRVGSNLNSALHCLRLVDSPRTIWVDAICINQDNNAERGQQVHIMKDIYTRAKTVRAYIDHEVADSEKDAFEQLSRVVDEDDIEHQPPKLWDPVLRLFRDPYFTRLWIQQELILASTAVIHLQNFTLSLQSLAAGWKGAVGLLAYRYIDLRNLRQPQDWLSGANSTERDFHGKNLDEWMGCIHLFTHILSSKDANTSQPQLIERGGRMLLELTSMASSLKMADPRDQVYGMLSLAQDVDPRDIIIDYSLRPVQVFAQIYGHYITQYANLNFLCSRLDNAKDLINTSLRLQKGIPTWQRAIAPGFSVRWGEAANSSASGGTSASKCSISPDGRILSGRGIHVDTITESFYSLSNMAHMPLSRILNSLESMHARVSPRRRKKPILDLDEIVSLFFYWMNDRQIQSGPSVVDRPQDPPMALKRWILSQIFQRSAVGPQHRGTMTLVDLLNNPEATHDIVPDGQREQFNRWLRVITDAITNIVPVGTTGGHIGKAMLNLYFPIAEDQVWILFGCAMPMLLRPNSREPGMYHVIGPVVIPAFMDGTACENIDTHGNPDDKYCGPDIQQIHLC
jgi:hypothetical protein